MNTYNITPKGDNSLISNNSNSIEMITFDMNSKSIIGKLRGIKPSKNCYYSTDINFKEHVVSSTFGLN